MLQRRKPAGLRFAKLTANLAEVRMLVQDILADKGGAVFSLGPDAGVAEAVAVMIERDISSIVVMDDQGMAGLITLRELLRGLSALGSGLVAAKVRDVMKPNPPVAKPDDTADHLRALMTDLHITHVPVVDAGKLVGILSFHDIAKSAIKDVAFENKLLKQYIRNWPE